jgi:hypothetical protein
MTEEMRYVVQGESRAQFKRWDNTVPGVRIVRQWLRDSLGFENATNEDAKAAQRILRQEFNEIATNPRKVKGRSTTLRTMASVTIQKLPNGVVKITARKLGNPVRRSGRKSRGRTARRRQE